MTKSLLLASVSLCAGFAFQPAFAQEADTTAEPVQVAETQAEDENEVKRIPVIVVTAQKREENLQSVPIAISAITAQSLADQGIRSTEDLAVAVGGLNVTRTTNATNFTLRGIGTQGGSTGQDSAIAMFVDGVYMPSMAGSTFALNNISRIEVLKGPQGTLYGRNATGGAVNVITKTPEEEFSVTGQLGYGDHATTEASAYVTGGFADGIAADLALYYRDQADGFGYNRIIDKDINKTSDLAIRSKLLAEITDSTTLTFAGDRSRTEGSWGIAYRPVPNSLLLDGTGYDEFVAAGNGFYDSISEFEPAFEIENFGGSFKFEQDIGENFTLTNILAYRGEKGAQRVEVDGTSLKIIDAPLFDEEEQLTEEIQLAYSGDKIQAIGGLFYMDAESRYDPFQIVGAAILGQTGGATDHLQIESSQTTKSYAAFGQVTWEFMTDTNLTVGLRYTKDERDLHADQFLLIGANPEPATGDVPRPSGGFQVPIGTVDQSETFSKPTWRVALDRQFTPDFMGYASISRGFKSGVFNLTSPADAPAEPETLDAYEIGIKSTINDRVRLNAATFFYEYENIQAFQVNGASTTLTNAATAEVYGVDFDFQAELGGGFSLTGSGAWLHHEYGEFPVATVSFLEQPAGAPDYAGYTPGLGNYVFPNCNDAAHSGQSYCSAAGNELVNTPDLTASLGVSHEMELGTGTLRSNISYSYNSGFNFAVDNREQQDAYGLVNAQIVWSGPDDQFNIRLWTRNLTDEQHLSSYNENGSGDIATPAPGQTYGASVGFKF